MFDCFGLRFGSQVGAMLATKFASRRPKRPPRRPRDASQEASKTPPRYKRPQEASKSPQEASKRPPGGPCWSQLGGVFNGCLIDSSQIDPSPAYRHFRFLRSPRTFKGRRKIVVSVSRGPQNTHIHIHIHMRFDQAVSSENSGWRL